MRTSTIGQWTVLLVNCLFLVSKDAAAQTFFGTNQPGTFQDFALNVSAGTTNLAISIGGSSTVWSHLLLKAGAAPSDSDFDFIAMANGRGNAINLELPELAITNYVLRVRTPTNSLAHSFSVTVATNVNDLRTVRPATKPLISTNQGSMVAGVWHYFRVDIPTNISGWRIRLSSTNNGPDLYVQHDMVPTTSSYLKRSQSLTNDIIPFAPSEITPGTYFIGVYQPSGAGSYTLRTELISFTTLTWDPGLTHSGTQVYTNQDTNGVDFYFKITTQNTALGAWRTALNVLAGEANIYLAKGTPPTLTGSQFKSERIGSDGFVVGAASFNAGEDWYFLVHAAAGAQWTLVTGEPFVTDLGTVATDGSSGSGNVAMGAEGMRFFKATVPVNTVAWRLWLNGLTNSVLVKKGGVPIPGASDLSQNGQMLVVPNYLVGGQLYFVGVPGNPGATINLDSRQQSFVDIPFAGATNLNVSGYGYTTFRVQVPVDQIAWQVSVVVSSGNPNLAVRRNLVPNESNNDAYSEVPGAVTDSILLVPPTLSDGTFYVTVYGTNAYSCVLQSGDPEVTDINFVSATLNTDTNRVGWRLFKVSDINSQVGALGWDLFVTNFTPGTRIALRRNAAPGIWTFRNPTPGTAGVYDYLSTADFLQRPGHQADVWYVGVYNPTNALGAFTLVTRELTADPLPFNSGSATRAAVPAGKWQFFRVDVPTNILGWDIRVTDVSSGSPQLVVRRELLPVSLNEIGFSGVINSTNWTPGYQWSAGSDWTARDLSSDGTMNESGRILTMGYGRPLEAATYYVGVLGAANSTNAMSYTVLSRGIGAGYAIPVQDIDYVSSVTNFALPVRDLAVYRVTISSNVPSWKVKLAPMAGDALLAVARGRVPNITALVNGSVTNDQTAGRKMLKAGNEQFVQLPPAYGTNVIPGQYYLVVVSEGIVVPGNTTWIGTDSSDYVLQSLGPMPEIDLGLLDTADILYSGQLEGGESVAFHFHNYPFPTTLGFELSLEDKIGNPVMVSRGTVDLADPGIANPGGLVPSDPYGNEGGQGTALAVSGAFIDVSDPYETETVMVKARAQGGLYPDAAYTLRILRFVAPTLAFDGGMTNIVTQTNNYQFFRVDVPPDALGWDVRITNVTAGSPQLVISRDMIALYAVTPGWNPGQNDFWPFGARWLADEDWTQRTYSSNGSTNESGRILAMGMGRPLEPGTYYVGVRNFAAPAPAAYTIVSRGIGYSYSIPVVDLPFAGGSVTNLSLPAREAAYYQVVIPPDAASWQAKLTSLSGESMLVTLTSSIPSVLSGRPASLGKAMQKPGNEHYVFVPANGQGFLQPGTNFLAVVSEGMAATNFPTRIGDGTSAYVLQSRGVMQPVDLGVIGNTETTHSDSLEGGEVRAYLFTVPDGTVSLEARLQNVTGNPAMVLRAGPLFPSPGAASPGTGTGSVTADDYGNEGGQSFTIANGNANSSLITVPNPSNSVYAVMVKARGSAGSYANATYTLSVRAANYAVVDFDGGSSTVTNQAIGTWRYFRVDVPANVLGWDVRLANVSSGLPRMAIRRDLLPTALTTTPWSTPGLVTSWPSSNQWAATADWTRRGYSADNSTLEDGRILAMGMGQPLEPGTYYIGVTSSTGTNTLSYTLLSRGIGDNLSLPVADLNYSGGSATNTLPPREAAYYRVNVLSNSPGWKLKLTPTSGEAMLVLLKDRVPNIDSGRSASPISGKFMQKAGNEHYVLLPGPTNIAAGTYYLAVVSEGVNPASATRIGTGTSSYTLTSLGDVQPINLGTVGPIDLVNSNSLEGGESRLYQFTVPPSAMAVELRLENRVGNPVMDFSTNSILPDPGGVLSGQRDAYGNDGGVNPADVNSNIITIANPPPGTYSLAVKARALGTAYPDAAYTLRVRQIPVPELNFTPEFNTNGLSNVGSGLLLDGQRAYYKVVVPTNVWDMPVIGWELDLSQLSGIAVVRVRKDALPSDTLASGMPFTPDSAIIAPPFLTNGTWYVEVRGTNSTQYTVTSSSLKVQRPAWIMPGTGEPTVTPGLTVPDFGDTGLDTNGVPLAGDQGIDLERGYYHYYAVIVPTNNAGLMRVQLDAISGNSDLYMRMNYVPTYSHRTNGTSGTAVDRTVTGSATAYGNWVPLNGQKETMLPPGTWYLAVRAVTNANARYRLRLSTGHVQDLDLFAGTVTNQSVAGGDWSYFRVQFPAEAPASWQITFSQQAGDVVLHLRDTVPPGNGNTIGSVDYKDWSTDQKNSGPYASYDGAGTYTFGVPPLRPGSVYYLGFRAKSDSTFSVSSTTSGPTNALLPIIEFYGGSATNMIPVGGWVGYRIFSPADALRWRHTSIHSNVVQVYIENGSMPTRTASDDFRSTVANSSQDKFMTNYPWLPNQVYYLVATNISAVPQPFSFTMNGSSTAADDDADGLPDAWEIQYFGTLARAPGADTDGDGVSNMNEYLEGTNPADRTSFQPRLFILATNGVVNVNPPGTNFVMGTTVTLTAVANAGYNFIDWGGAASGAANPLILVMNTNKTIIPRFRVPADDFDQRIPLTGYSVSHSGLQNIGATKEPGEPNHAGNAGGKSLWWTWTAPVSGTVIVTTAGTDFRNALGVYTGFSVSALNVIAANLAGAGTNTSQVSFTAVAGTVYQIAVDGYNGASGTVTLNITMPDVILLDNPSRQGDGLFHFTLISSAGRILRVDATTNFLDWDPVVTVTNIPGTMEIVDPQSTNFPFRFYRAVVP